MNIQINGFWQNMPHAENMKCHFMFLGDHSYFFQQPVLKC